MSKKNLILRRTKEHFYVNDLRVSRDMYILMLEELIREDNIATVIVDTNFENDSESDYEPHNNLPEASTTEVEK